MAINSDIISYYQNLLILQYKGKPKAEATIEAFLKVLCIFEIIDAVEDGYNIDDAEGVQLDVIGKYVGVSRVIVGISFERSYWGFIGYGDDPGAAIFNPFMGYGVDPDNDLLVLSDGSHLVFSDGARFALENNKGNSEIPPDVQFYGYGDNQKSILSLNDTEYRTLLRFKILINYSNCSMKDIDDFLFEYYGTDVYVTDHFDRTITYTFPTQDTRLASILKYTNCLPKSAGTQILLAFEPHT